MSLNWKGAGKMRIGKTIGNKVVFLVFCFKKAISVCENKKASSAHEAGTYTHTQPVEFNQEDT